MCSIALLSQMPPLKRHHNQRPHKKPVDRNTENRNGKNTEGENGPEAKSQGGKQIPLLDGSKKQATAGARVKTWEVLAVAAITGRKAGRGAMSIGL